MNNQFNPKIIQPHHVALLKEVEDGWSAWRPGIADLYQRQLVEQISPYAVQLTPAGRFAVRGILVGGLVVISQDYKIPQLHGHVGVVLNISTWQEDYDGVDQYGYKLPRARFHASAEVRLADRSGLWNFHKPTDLTGLPRLQGQINEYWKNIC